MEVIGRIDNASGLGADGTKAIFHLIFTYGSLVIAKVLDRKKYIREHPLRGQNFGSGLSGTYMAAKALTVQMIDEAQARGLEIEKDLDSYVESNPEGLRIIKYSEISEVRFSGGSIFSLPYIQFITSEGDFNFKLNHDNYEKAGKLKKETYNSYHSALSHVFEGILKIK